MVSAPGLVASGLVACNNGRLVGTFDVGGSRRYIDVDVKPSNESFECSDATLTYESVAQLFGNCKWTGAAGKDDIEMKFDSGVTITGPLATPRQSSKRIRGAGTWSTAKSTLRQNSANSGNEQRGDVDNALAREIPPPDAVRDPHKLLREKQLLESGSPIIAIFGQSGVGKSTFTNLIASKHQKVGKGLQSCTSDINVIEATVDGKRVVVIDTPGIDDTHAGKKEADVLVDIAHRLADMGEHRVWVTGVLYLHRISDNKFSQTADRVSNMVKSLCGDVAMDHLTLCTTMWDTVPDEEGYDRFDELCETATWRTMISNGAGTAMISNVDPNAKAEAEKIVSELIKNAPTVELAIQDEMINQGKTVLQTGAGQVLDQHLREVRAEAERKMHVLRETMHKENVAAEARMMEKMRKQESELERLRKLAETQAHEMQAQAEHLRQEREAAARQRHELQESMRRENEASAARMREAKTMAHDLRAQAERLAQEQEKAKEEMARLNDCVSRLDGAHAAMMQEQNKLHAEQLRKSQGEVEKLRESMKRERKAAAEREQQAIRAHEQEMAELRRQTIALDQRRSFFWWLNPIHLILAGIDAFLVI